MIANYGNEFVKEKVKRNRAKKFVLKTLFFMPFHFPFKVNKRKKPPF